MYFRNLLLILIALTASYQLSSAQTRFGRFLQERMELGVQAGASGYIGELNDKAHGFSAPGKDTFTIGGGVKYYLNSIAAQDRTWGVALNYNFTRINGDDLSSATSKGLEFTNNIHEASARAEFQFFNFRPNRVKNLLSPYLFAGVGMIWHNPKDQDGASLLNNLTYDSKNYDSKNKVPSRSFIPTIPFGVGVKYGLKGTTAPISIGLELQYRYAFTSFLDGVGRDAVKGSAPTGPFPTINIPYQDDPNIPQYVSSSELQPDFTTYQGNNKNDFFMTGVFKVTYTFYRWRDPLWK